LLCKKSYDNYIIRCFIRFNNWNIFQEYLRIILKILDKHRNILKILKRYTKNGWKIEKKTEKFRAKEVFKNVRFDTDGANLISDSVMYTA
jgi:hypothetical protein